MPIYIYIHKQGYNLDESLTPKQVAETLAYKTLVRDALHKALVKWFNDNVAFKWDKYFVVVLPLVRL